MTFNKQTKILIVGLGVIGGGYAAALTERGYKVSCITKNQADIDYAKERNMISYGTTHADEKLIRESELIIFALYPSTFIRWIEEHGHLISPGTLITDVSGVKSSVVYKVQALLCKDVEFISAHPMAGRESSGVEYSDPSVFLGANYIVTPTENNTKEAIEICKRLGEELGFSRISELSPAEHDKMIAFLSQLTHCIAISLMTCNDKENMEKFTGDSFRDLTRIARINDLMWSELFIANKDALLKQMNLFIDKFTELKTMIEQEDIPKMRKMMQHSTARRALFDKK